MFDELNRARLEALGKKLKERRLERGITLLRLSAASGVHASYIGRSERAERRPSADILRKLAEPLGFTETELLKSAGYLSPDKVDDRIARFKTELKFEIDTVMTNLKEKVDCL